MPRPGYSIKGTPRSADEPKRPDQRTKEEAHKETLIKEFIASHREPFDKKLKDKDKRKKLLIIQNDINKLFKKTK